MVWTLDVCERDGTVLDADATFRSARLTWALGGDGSFEVQLRPSDVPGSWRAGQRRIVFKRNGNAKLACYQTNIARNGPPGDRQFSAAGVGLSSALVNRVIHDAYYLTDDAHAVAWSLIQNAAAQTGGDEGFTDGPNHGGVLPTRSRYYCDGDKVYDSIAELSQFKAGGFDWEINGLGQFETWKGGRGDDLTGDVSVTDADFNDFTIEEDTTDLLTDAMAFGGDTSNCDKQWVTRHTGTAHLYGRREDVVTVDKVDSDDDLDDAADELLRQRRSAALRLHVAYIDTRGPWAFGDVWLGDQIEVAMGTMFGGTQPMRVTTVNATLEPGTHVFMEYDLESFPSDEDS